MSLLTQQVTNTAATSVPSYLQPYFTRGLDRAESAFTEAYKPYTGQRTAGLAPIETQAINSAAGIQTPGQFAQAGDVMNRAASGILGLTGFQAGRLGGQGFNPTQFTSGYAANSAAYNPFANYQAGNIGSDYKAGQTTGGVFDGGAAQQYMSPYQQNVTDIARREAERDFQKQQTQLRARAGAAGAFGGSRATLLETENQRNQNQLLDDIQTKGLQSAFTNAQDQFERDRAARLAAFQQNEGARQSQAQLGLTGQQAQEAARRSAAELGLSAVGQLERDRQAQATLGLDAQRLGDASRQFGATNDINRFRTQEEARQAAAGIGLRGFEGAANIGQGIGQLGSQIGVDRRANIATQLDAGQTQRAQQQLNLNNQYEQFLEERGFPREQAKNFAEVLSTLGQNQRVVSSTGQAPTTTAEILGLLTQGIGGLGVLGDGSVSGGLNNLAGGANTLLSGLTSLFGGSNPFANSGPGATGGVFTGGLDDADFNPFDQGGFLSGVGEFFSPVTNLIGSFFD